MNTRTLGWIESELQGSPGGLVSGFIAGNDDVAWRGATVDTRTECSGRIFFALRGENADGHAFVDSAFERGCVAAVIEDRDLSSRLTTDGMSHFLVGDAKQALQDLARSYRKTMDLHAVAITGSGGKTTTKEYVRSILRRSARVHSSPGNFNNTIGVPLTVLDADPDSDLLVCEIGANQKGEVGFLAEMTAPDVGVITNIGDAHVGYFGSRDCIALAKAELLDHLSASGVAVLNRDDDYFDMLHEKSHCRVVSFGRSTSADFVLSETIADRFGQKMKVNGVDIRLTSVGAYNAMNACAAVAVADACGVDLRSAAQALAEVKPMPGRGKIHVTNGVTLIDESYNASPASMVGSLQMLAEFAGAHRLAVLGDMKELGSFTEELHASVGRVLDQTGLDCVCWVGECARFVGDAMKGATVFHALSSWQEAMAVVRSVVSAGDVMLVKGSNACGLDEFVSAFVGKGQE